jgi:hypothetical protein
MFIEACMFTHLFLLQQSCNNYISSYKKNGVFVYLNIYTFYCFASSFIIRLNAYSILSNKNSTHTHKIR